MKMGVKKQLAVERRKTFKTEGGPKPVNSNINDGEHNNTMLSILSLRQPLEGVEDDNHGNSDKPAVCNCKKIVNLIYEYMYNVLFLLCLQIQMYKMRGHLLSSQEPISIQKLQK